jgi:hypothetical protein
VKYKGCGYKTLKIFCTRREHDNHCKGIVDVNPQFCEMCSFSGVFSQQLISWFIENAVILTVLSKEKNYKRNEILYY